LFDRLDILVDAYIIPKIFLVCFKEKRRFLEKIFVKNHDDIISKNVKVTPL
jgi:hypothetical protein